MFTRSPFNYDRNEASNLSAVAFPEETLAQQHFKEHCDINRIVAQYAKTGLVPQSAATPMAEDFVGITDYHTAMNVIRRGDEAFSSLSADVREKFKNDAGRFVDFCLDPENLDEVIALGLAPQRAAVEASPQPVLTGGDSQEQ
jgi:phage internal scaffolding protein